MSYSNTRESFGEIEIAVETLACGSCFHSISRSPKLHSCYHNSVETRKTFTIWYAEHIENHLLLGKLTMTFRKICTLYVDLGRKLVARNEI